MLQHTEVLWLTNGAPILRWALLAGQCTMSQIRNSGSLVHGSSNEFSVLKWSPCSPDLNPIEHLLDIREREIWILDMQSTNVELWDRAKFWKNTSRRPFEFMLKRIEAVQKSTQPGTRIPNKMNSECILLDIIILY